MADTMRCVSPADRLAAWSEGPGEAEEARPAPAFLLARLAHHYLHLLELLDAALAHIE